MKYQVFARINPGDDLIDVGNVDAPNDRLAKTYARTTFDEEDWDRMVIVPRDALLEVTDAEGKRPDSLEEETA
jgi:hypothetical protein